MNNDIENWFVLPDASDRGENEDTKVVIGSPVIDTLRERYIAEHKIEKVPEFSAEDLAQMSGDARLEAERELSRQRDFVESCKESDKIFDQDILVLQIAAKFTTTSYQTVQSVTDPNDHFIKKYYLSAGCISIKYDFDKKMHAIEIQGTIPGRFAIAIKRRTASGRIIDDSYAIVEIENSVPAFYAYSSKGIQAIINVDDIKRAAAPIKTTLAVPTSARIASEKEIAVLKEPSTPVKVPDVPVAGASILRDRITSLQKLVATSDKDGQSAGR